MCVLNIGVTPASIGLGFMVQSLGTDDHRIAKMAQQVKDVLPHVPLNVIAKDLGRPQLECIFRYLDTSILQATYFHFCSMSFLFAIHLQLSLHSKNQLC